jgi:hypothetical protein
VRFLANRFDPEGKRIADVLGSPQESPQPPLTRRKIYVRVPEPYEAPEDEPEDTYILGGTVQLFQPTLPPEFATGRVIKAVAKMNNCIIPVREIESRFKM